jgi:hypothetical protein
MLGEVEIICSGFVGSCLVDARDILELQLKGALLLCFELARDALR